MSKIEIAPENPSSRKLALSKKWFCDYCKKEFTMRDDFISHLEKTKHRICYKCGQKVGGWKEWVAGSYIAKRQVSEDGSESWKYVHISCPSISPSRRGTEIAL